MLAPVVRKLPRNGGLPSPAADNSSSPLLGQSPPCPPTRGIEWTVPEARCYTRTEGPRSSRRAPPREPRHGPTASRRSCLFVKRGPGRGAPGSRTIQVSIHRQRHPQGQAGAASGSHALAGVGCRPGCGHRGGRTEKLARLEAKRSPRPVPLAELEQTPTAPRSRHIPAAVRRVVVERDGNRCRFLDAKGRRCSERNRLEFHHVYPFGHGGGHSPANVGLLCKTHNLLMAEQDYGRKTLERNRESEAVRRRPGVEPQTNKAP